MTLGQWSAAEEPLYFLRRSRKDFVTVGQWAGFPGGSDGKESACNAGDPRLGGREDPGEGNDNPLQYSCLGNAMDSGV